LAYFETEYLWIDFLMHGYIDHQKDDLCITVKSLNIEEYRNFKILIEKYFDFGFEFFIPMAMKSAIEQNFIKDKYEK